MTLRLPCPTCGVRPSTEFTYGGELRPLDAPDPHADFERVYLRDNDGGLEDERWFHASGCRRWITIRRDTTTDRIEA